MTKKSILTEEEQLEAHKKAYAMANGVNLENVSAFRIEESCKTMMAAAMLLVKGFNELRLENPNLPEEELLPLLEVFASLAMAAEIHAVEFVFSLSKIPQEIGERIIMEASKKALGLKDMLIKVSREARNGSS